MDEWDPHPGDVGEDEEDALPMAPVLQTLNPPPNRPNVKDEKLTPVGPAPVSTPGIKALQVTLGQFIGKMTEVMACIFLNECAQLGTDHGGLNAPHSVKLERVRQYIVPETTQLKSVETKSERCTWEDYLIKFEL